MYNSTKEHRVKKDVAGNTISIHNKTLETALQTSTMPSVRGQPDPSFPCESALFIDYREREERFNRKQPSL